MVKRRLDDNSSTTLFHSYKQPDGRLFNRTAVEVGHPGGTLKIGPFVRL